VNVYFDTEFTKLPGSREGYPGLISIGCVSSEGYTFYAELSDTWNEEVCSEFVIKNVLPLLQGGEFRMKESKLAVRLKDWVEHLTDEEVIFRSDAPGVDWPWVEQLFTFYGCWPKNLRRRCGTIYFDEETQADRYQEGLEKFWQEHSKRRHHALFDAKSLLFAWRFAIKTDYALIEFVEKRELNAPIPKDMEAWELMVDVGKEKE